jgi:hypothetical protein
MNEVSERMNEFFQEFGRANNSFDPKLLAPLFADTIVGADPNGGVMALTKEEFLAGTAERRAYLDTLGFQSVTVVPIEEIALAGRYTMVRTHGVMRLQKDTGEPVELIHDSIYVIYAAEGSPRIVFTLSHDDPRQMIDDQGQRSPRE